jgi:hypothetical protein
MGRGSRTASRRGRAGAGVRVAPIHIRPDRLRSAEAASLHPRTAGPQTEIAAAKANLRAYLRFGWPYGERCANNVCSPSDPTEAVVRLDSAPARTEPPRRVAHLLGPLRDNLRKSPWAS